MRLWQEDTKLTKQLHNAIVDSLSPALQLEITDPVLNFIILDCNAIMTQMENLFNAPTATSIAELKNQMQEPLQGQDQTTFIDHCSKFKVSVAELLRIGQAVSHFEQCWQFEQTCTSQPAAAAAIERFKQQNTNCQVWRLQAIMTYALEQLAITTTADGGYAHFAHGNISDVVKEVVESMVSQGMVLCKNPPTFGGPVRPRPGGMHISSRTRAEDTLLLQKWLWSQRGCLPCHEGQCIFHRCPT